MLLLFFIHKQIQMNIKKHYRLQQQKKKKKTSRREKLKQKELKTSRKRLKIIHASTLPQSVD